MCFGRIILPIETNESTIATQCGLLSAHSNLPAVTCMTVLVELFYSLKRMNPLLEHTMHKLYTNEKLSDY